MRLILAFAVPLFIGNIFQQVYSMVDTMIAGYTLGDNAIAAIGATSSLYGLLINFASGLNNGYAIVVTQRFGAHDEKNLKQTVGGMIKLDIIAALLLTVFSLVFLKPLMRFMNTPEAIFGEAYSYIFVICAGMAATVCYNMFAGILRAVGNSRAPLFFLIISSVLNIFLDVIFVAVLNMGVSGAAFATVIAQTISAAMCGVYVFKKYRSILPNRGDLRVPAKTLSELLSQGIAMGLMLCVVDFGSVIFQRANNELGEIIISAHTVSRRIISIMMQPLATISTASSTFIGQNWGAGKKSRIKFALGRVLLMEIIWSLFACGMIYAFGGALVRFTTGTEDSFIIKNAVMSLRWHLSFFPVLGCLLALRTAMQAMGKKIAPIVSSCLELGMKILSAAFLIPRLGFFGTSITEPITWTVMLMFLICAYLRIRGTVLYQNQNNKKELLNYDRA
ncbi:MAG: MATE family efflux transporter [Eubacterium sp.]|nr:MATE family efflux transporter [Eubacterium sp.]